MSTGTVHIAMNDAKFAELSEFSGIDAYTLADGARRCGTGGVIHALKPQTTRSQFIGRALTARIRHEPNRDIPLKDYGAGPMLDRARSGDVLILDGGGLFLTMLGDLAVASLALSGAAGVVVNGCVRDVEEMESDGLPVFALGSAITTIAGHGYVTDIGEPLHMYGIRIATGDLVAGCRGGIIAADWEARKSVLEQARRIQESDQRVLAGIRGGTPVGELWQQHKNFDD